MAELVMAIELLAVIDGALTYRFRKLEYMI